MNQSSNPHLRHKIDQSATLNTTSTAAAADGDVWFLRTISRNDSSKNLSRLKISSVIVLYERNGVHKCYVVILCDLGKLLLYTYNIIYYNNYIIIELLTVAFIYFSNLKSNLGPNHVQVKL